MSEKIELTQEELKNFGVKNEEIGKIKANNENLTLSNADMTKTIEDLKTEKESITKELDLQKTKSISFHNSHSVTSTDRAEAQLIAVGEFVKATNDKKIAGRDQSEIVKIASNRLKESARSVAEKEAIKIMNADNVADGGFLVEDTNSNEVIPFIYANSIVEKLGLDVIQSPNGSFEESKGSTGFNPAWSERNTAPTIQDISMEKIRLTDKWIKRGIVIDNRLLTGTSVNLGAYVSNQLGEACQPVIDQAFFDGLGSLNQPNGIDNQMLASNKFDSTGATNPNVITDFNELQYLVESHIHNLSINSKYIMSPRTKYALLSLVNSANDDLSSVAQQMLQGRIQGFEFISSTTIPINLGGGAESEVYFVDPSKVRVAQTSPIQLFTKNTGSFNYTDSVGSSQMIGLDETKQTAIWVETAMDWALKYDGAVSKMEAVSY